jgi:GNAT superfamily N-acetyltransferase
MNIDSAAVSDITQSVDCLSMAFARDPITGFLLQTGPGYPDRVARFFSLLMRARIALDMPVLVARGIAGICGASMGYTTGRPEWPRDLAEEWDRFESSIPGFTGRMAIYDGISARFMPPSPHYYLGVIGVRPDLHGHGYGMQLLKAFCDLSAGDDLSTGVYLETAEASNVRFYERAGFTETGRGSLEGNTLWCMHLPHRRR